MDWMFSYGSWNLASANRGWESSMQKRKRWLLYVAIAACSISLAGTALLRFRSGSISRSNFDRIQVGMTATEVEEILGGPPGYYGTGMYFASIRRFPPWGE